MTQHDGLIVSERSVIGVELKLNAQSSLNQVIKYAALMAWEERVSGPKDHLGLLYVLLPSSRDRHWAACGLDGPRIDSTALDRIDLDDLPVRVRQLCRDQRDEILSVLDRMRLTSMSWIDVMSSCEAFLVDLNMEHPGDQCLKKLVDGFIAQVMDHLRVTEREFIFK